MNPSECIGMGAEAIIEHTDFMDYEAVRKTRPRKMYRHPDLDRELRSSRTRNEVRIIREARRSGVRTPVIYDVDASEGTIVMEFIKGARVKDEIDRGSESSERICREIGMSIAKMHNSDICHGDLTTSNMILTESGELCLLDFSLGSMKCGLEEKGVDIHLLERAFTSAHSGSAHLFRIVMDSYLANVEGAGSIAKRIEDIKKRARYT